jgi:2-amino-4-hydroxy-6-hydroxymethyldihydropteridine diphosphokinase
MSLILATGSNIGNSIQTLNEASDVLDQRFGLIAKSQIYISKAIEYENQPDFYNQVLEFNLSALLTPDEVMRDLLKIEKNFGRNRDIPKGPRTLDIDIIFWGLKKINSEHITIPHPRWKERSFVVKPLQELPFFQTIEKCFTIPKSFSVDAFPI